MKLLLTALKLIQIARKVNSDGRRRLLAGAISEGIFPLFFLGSDHDRRGVGARADIFADAAADAQVRDHVDLLHFLEFAAEIVHFDFAEAIALSGTGQCSSQTAQL